MIDAVELQGTRQHLTFDGLVGEEMSEYGIYPAAHNVTVTNCRVGNPNNLAVKGTYHRHGFRFYGNNLRVVDCSAHNVSNYGLWPVSANGVVIENFTGNSAVVFGPNENPTDSSPSERLYNLEAYDIHITRSPYYPDSLTGMRAQLGTWRACIFDSSIDQQDVFKVGQGTDLPPRPTNRIHWANFAGAIDDDHDNPDCVGTDIGPADCWGDIDRSGAVDVDDLITVILEWGACPGPPQLPTTLGDPCPSSLSPCVADIAPFVCGNNAVDVDDLIAVILHWGSCANFSREGAAKTLEDCENMCAGASNYQDCYDKCREAVCQSNPEACDQHAPPPDP